MNLYRIFCATFSYLCSFNFVAIHSYINIASIIMHLVFSLQRVLKRTSRRKDFSQKDLKINSQSLLV